MPSDVNVHVNAHINTSDVELRTRQWFDRVVLGLNLCPFAHRPARQQRIHLTVCTADDEAMLMQRVLEEIRSLDALTITERETTLIVIPAMLDDFYDYQFFLNEVQRQLKRYHWQDTFQLASFHPDYCFSGSAPDDSSNLTNRSPFPIIHLLRQDSLNQALSDDDSKHTIVERNIDTMAKLNPKEKARLFPYLTHG